jgi:hypothetical protein
MGIEPTRAALQRLRDMGSRVAPILKCDWRVNFRGTLGHVGMPERHAATSDDDERLADQISLPAAACGRANRQFCRFVVFFHSG